MKEKSCKLTTCEIGGIVSNINYNCLICNYYRTWKEWDEEICYNCINIKRQEKINEILK